MDYKTPFACKRPRQSAGALIGRVSSYLLAVAAVVLLLSGCGSPSNDSEGSTKKKASSKGSTMQVLFSMDLDSGSLRASNDGYELNVVPNGTSVVWFADRPDRKAGKISVADLVGEWDDDFSDDPPNAALVIDIPGAGRRPTGEVVEPQPVATTIAVTIDKPVLEGDGSVTFEASIIEDFDENGPLAHLDQLKASDKVHDFKQASLFIDDLCMLNTYWGPVPGPCPA